MILLVWPFQAPYGRRQFVPLGLLKIASYYREQGDEVCLTSQIYPLIDKPPDRVCIGTLFTYDRRPVIETVLATRGAWPNAEVSIGGLWASLMPADVQATTGIAPHVGLLDWAEDVPPAWDLWPGDTSVAFASRGCVRRCPWCAATTHDGAGFRPKSVATVLSQLDLSRLKVELWDNNILAHPGFAELAERLIGLGKQVSIPQGLDARLVTWENAYLIRRLGARNVYLAYDSPEMREPVRQAIDLLRRRGVSGNHLLVYVLYDFYDPTTGQGDTPDEIYRRVDEICRWGACAYPMRYRPTDSVDKHFVSPLWDERELWLFNRARGDASHGTGVINLPRFEKDEYLRRRAKQTRAPALGL